MENLTFTELVDIYMKMDKETLAQLLAIKELTGKNTEYVPGYVPPYEFPPYAPSYPSTPWYTSEQRPRKWWEWEITGEGHKPWFETTSCDGIK